MSCIQMTAAMAEMLEALARGEEFEQFRSTNEWSHARAFGWVLDSGELTEAGHRHVVGHADKMLPPSSTPSRESNSSETPVV